MSIFLPPSSPSVFPFSQSPVQVNFELSPFFVLLIDFFKRRFFFFGLRLKFLPFYQSFLALPSLHYS